MSSYCLKNNLIEINKEIKLNSRRQPDISADPSSENPPQYKHYQLRHTIKTRVLLTNVNKDCFSQFSAFLSLQNFPFIK